MDPNSFEKIKEFFEDITLWKGVVGTVVGGLILAGIIAFLTRLFRKSTTKDSTPALEQETIIHREDSQEEVPSELRVYTSKLPVTGSKLFGRDEQLGQLDEAWGDEHCHILSFVAFGGIGKTAVVNEWLGRMERKGWGGARRVYGWSFYSQGTKEDRQASGDAFLVHALEWFGDKETAESSKSAWDKGVRLVELVRGEKTLLILDGLEPLQYPPGPMYGKLKDQGLGALLRELCHGMDGLCVISTREKIEDLETNLGHAVKRQFLETLTPEAGMAVLRNEGVKDGTDDELKQVSNDFGGHALALTLLGNYLSVVHDGEIRKRDMIPHLTDDEKKGGHAKRVMASYEDWLKETPELDILYLMGLFDRPAEMGAIEVLSAEPVIEGLTDNLTGLEEAKWKYAIKRLRGLGMLAKEDEEVSLDCHPLVREHFGEKLEKKRPKAWREAHGRLYEYYKGQPEKLYDKHLPDTVEEMEPLFRAVYHGCAAEKYQETFEEVYYSRIQRDGQTNYCCAQLGAFGSDLGAVSCFFEKLWSRPAEDLTESDKAVVLSFAGFRLRAVGRLGEAAEPMKAAVENYIKLGDWENAARVSGNLSEVYLTIGEVGRAKDFAEKSVGYAEKSGDWFQKMSKRTTLGDVLHQARQVERAKELFEEAERIQKENQQGYPYLYSLWGYRYCDLLLSLGKIDEVKERASQTLEWAKQGGLSLLTQALDKLSLGRTQVLEYQKLKIKNKKDTDESKKVLAEAKKWLDAAVDGLRESGNQDDIPRGLFARAEVYREMGDLEGAQRDVGEARQIAERGGMKLWMVDVFLEEGRTNWAMGEKGKAGECGQEAKALIKSTGYHRRDGEAEELK